MSLTEFSSLVRRALPYVVLGLLVLLIIFYSFKLLFIFLTPPPTQKTNIDVAFGKIEAPKFSEATSSAGFKFSLDTIEGVPVTATSAANVYFLPDSPVRFGYQDKVALVAKNFGFDTTQIRYLLSGKTVTYENGGRTLNIDIGNYNFKYESTTSAAVFITGSLTKSQTDIVNDAITFLKSVGRYPDELATGTTNVIYLAYDLPSQDFINVQKSALAQAVEVDFYRPTVGGLDVVTPKFFNSQNYVVLNYNGDTPNVLKAQINFFEKSDSQMGVYPVITGDQAWADLKAGDATVVAGQAGLKNISIKKMGLYYFDPDIYQSYLEPVYVFIGDNDFVAYLPAINPNYLTPSR